PERDQGTRKKAGERSDGSAHHPRSQHPSGRSEQQQGRNYEGLKQMLQHVHGENPRIGKLVDRGMGVEDQAERERKPCCLAAARTPARKPARTAIEHGEHGTSNRNARMLAETIKVHRVSPWPILTPDGATGTRTASAARPPAAPQSSAEK